MNSSNPPPNRILPVLQKIKESYLLWYGHYQVMPKIHRHTLGQKIDNIFIEIIQAIATASFLSRNEKLPYIRLSIQKTDTLKILLMILWETKTYGDKKYISLSVKLEEVGRMLGGWHGQLIKQNSPGAKPGEK